MLYFMLKTQSIYLTYHLTYRTLILNGNLIINHLFKFNGRITMHNNVFTVHIINRISVRVYIVMYMRCFENGIC